jgi:hypothetical protein
MGDFAKFRAGGLASRLVAARRGRASHSIVSACPPAVTSASVFFGPWLLGA